MADPARPIVDTLRPHFSWSQLWTFLQCNFRFYFRYVLGVPEPQNLDMSRGSAGHTTLELNARHKISTAVDLPMQQIEDTFSSEFDKELQEVEELEPGEDAGKTKDLTIEALRVYRHDKKLGAPTVTPIAVEVDFTMPFPETEEFEGMKPITGKIDQVGIRTRVVIPNGRPVERKVVEDYKFPARKPSNAQVRADMSPQLTIYDLVASSAGQPPDDLGFVNIIPPTKTLPARIEPAYRSWQEMLPERRAAKHARLLYTIKQAIRQIRAGIFYPTDDPRVCAYCPYNKICQNSLVKDNYTKLLLTGKHV